MNLLEHYQQYPDTFMINKHPDKDLYLVKYIHLGIDWSIEGALDARGLILDSSGNVIARPYKKFFNYKELEGRDDLPEHIRQLSEWEDDEEYTVYEKVDGSLIIMFMYEGELVIASSGSFVSDHVEKATELFNKMLKRQQKALKELMSMKMTLLFELVSPKFQIVVHYPKEELILHGVIDNIKGGLDSSDFSVYFIKQRFGVLTAETFNFTKEELEKAQTDLKDVEGFVVRFESGKMLKIKTEDYFEKSKDIAIFFGRFFTYRKISIVVESIFNDAYDDLVASANSHPKIKENIETVFTFYKEFETELLQFKKKWITGEFNDRKLIATSPETKPKMHMIFLALKDRDQWKEPFRQLAYKKFIKDVK